MLLTTKEAREIDRQAIEEIGIPGAVLMENAGRGMAQLLLSKGAGEQVIICCGRGNNGGDGFVIARHLDNADVKTQVLLFAKAADLRGDAALNYHIAVKSGIAVDEIDPESLNLERVREKLAGSSWIVDALFGSGLQGPLRAPFDQVVEAINAAAGPRRVLAVDVPSGLDADSGKPHGAVVRADHTATILAMRVGFVQAHAREWIGEVHVMDIGVPRMLLKPYAKS